MREFESSQLLGINFLNICQLDLEYLILSEDKGQAIIVTPNVDHVIRYNSDNIYKKLVDDADIVVNDSRILRLIAKYIFNTSLTLVTGSDLTRALLENSLIHENEVVFIGAEQEDISVISSNYKLKKYTHINPSYGFINKLEEVDSIVEQCKNLPPSIYFLAVGSPQQEKLAAILKSNGVEGVFLCIGASLLFLSGKEVRAPKLFQVLNLEWLFRMIQQPNRLFKRYFHGFFKLLFLVKKYK